MTKHIKDCRECIWCHEQTTGWVCVEPCYQGKDHVFGAAKIKDPYDVCSKGVQRRAG